MREQFRRCVRPRGAILGIAGNVTLEQLLPVLEETYQDWTGENEIVLKTGDRGVYRDHLDHESTQTHIGVAYPAVPYGADNYYQAWAAVSVLSGGMSSRLFTEVREKRGLCYSVYASLSSSKDEGVVLCRDDCRTSSRDAGCDAEGTESTGRGDRRGGTGAV